MSVVSYPQPNSKIVYCIVDRISTYASNWTQELIKNLSDFTVSNIWIKQYSVLVGLDEDVLLHTACEQGYTHAVVVSTGTEFINGTKFFDSVNDLVKDDFFIAGHVLDRDQAYYELHHQCYIINLTTYNQIGRPEIGQQTLGSTHTQFVPTRSIENYHDDYTPLWIKPGLEQKNYSHKLHGWNILSIALDLDKPIRIFSDEQRNNKKHYYPENPIEFQKHISYAYQKQSVCADQFVHAGNNETVDIPDHNFECVITPASGTWWIDYIHKINPVTVVYYDYNQSALDHWTEHAPQIDNVSYKFVKIDLLTADTYTDLIHNSNKTIINLSNIFSYEGTSMFVSLAYKQYKENELLKQLPQDYYVLFNGRSSLGFNTVASYYGQHIEAVNIQHLVKPTWHMNQDWQ